MEQEFGTVGVLRPSNNIILVAELEALLPAGTAIAVRSVEATGADSDALLRMSMEAEGAVAGLTDADVIVYACASTGYAQGVLDDKRFMAQLTGRVGRPCFSASHAGAQMLRDRGARRISVLSPYPPDIQPLISPYYAAYGIEVVDEAHFDLAIDAVGFLSPERIVDTARTLRRDVDALAILATDIPTLGVTAALEQELDIPVIATNQAIAWFVARQLRDSSSATSASFPR